MNFIFVFQDLKPSNIAVNEDCELKVLLHNSFAVEISLIFVN